MEEPVGQDLRAQIAEYDTALLAGRAKQVRDRVLAVRTRADQLGYTPLRARAGRAFFLDIGREDALTAQDHA